MENKNMLTVSTQDAVTPLQINAGVKITLLGGEYVAVFAKGEDGSLSFVIMPEEGTEAKECTIAELCAGVNGLVQGAAEDPSLAPIDEANVEQQMGPYLKQETDIDIKSMKLKLNQLFLYIHKVPEAETVVQYAFSISIDASAMGLNFGQAVALKEVWLSLWNTDFEKILQKMQLQDIEKMLK